MKLYCMAIECKNELDKEKSDIRIEHFFADNKEHMEDRIVEIVKAIKLSGVETIQYNYFEVGNVDGLDFNKLLNIVKIRRWA